jgi:hypothetical protein
LLNAYRQLHLLMYNGIQTGKLSTKIRRPREIPMPDPIKDIPDDCPEWLASACRIGENTLKSMRRAFNHGTADGNDVEDARMARDLYWEILQRQSWRKPRKP